MHIPAHTLRAEVAISTAAITIPALAWANYKAREEKARWMQLLGMTALILGLQSINIPISGGTSGHLLGGTLLAVLFGPYLGSLAIATVFVIQAAFLGDGGLDALGANILNGGLIGSLLGFVIFKTLNARISNQSISLFLASSFAFIAGALLCSAELGLSGFGAFKNITNDMLSGSLAWILLEGVLSVTIAQLFWLQERAALSTKRMVLPFALAGMISLGLHPWISSSKPDSLESLISKHQETPQPR